MIAYTQDCIIGSEFACKVLCVFPLMQCSDTINLLWAMFGKDVCRFIALFYYVVAFSSLLLNIGILTVHCRNLARALFPFLSFFFLIVPVLFLVFLFFLGNLCKHKNSLAGRPAIIIIISLCLSKLIKLQTNVTSFCFCFLYRTV